MVDEQSKSLFLTHQERLVEYFDTFTPRMRGKMADAYGMARDDAESIADFWLESPDHVREVVRERVKSSVGWRVIEEAALEHDLGLAVDWVPSRERNRLQDLGLIRAIKGDDGSHLAIMPAGVAALFADQVKGQRGSLVLLLGRGEEERIDELAKTWGVDEGRSWLEKVLLLSDEMVHPDAVSGVLESLPEPGWIGDAMMVMELGGLCFWQQIFGYDVESGEGMAEKVVPLMRRDERQFQQDVAESLMDLGVLFRIEGGDLEYPMVAVPEELWMGLWDLGMQWLTEWVSQAFDNLMEVGAGGGTEKEEGLQPVMKWLLCEAEAGRLKWEGTGFSEESVAALERVYRGGNPHWEDWAELGFQYRILSLAEEVEAQRRKVVRGCDAEALLNRSRLGFYRECLLEWCTGYSGRRADEKLGEALGIDEDWRQRAVTLMERHGEMQPVWMEYSGVESSTTGGGWLREPESGNDQLIMFESVVASTFVATTKLSWLDVLSLLEPNRYYPKATVVELMQCCAATAMFTQLGIVLGQQPAAVYLPFQRSSFLMDEMHQSRIEEWVGDILEHLLVPLGVARVHGETVAIEPQGLRIQTPAGWPEEERESLIREICGDDLQFEIPDGRDLGLREVARVDRQDEEKVAIDLDLTALLEQVEGEEIQAFDGKFLYLGDG